MQVRRWFLIISCFCAFGCFAAPASAQVDLECRAGGPGEILATWVNDEEFLVINLTVDDVLVGILDGDATSAVVEIPVDAAASVEVCVAGVIVFAAPGVCCTFDLPPPPVVDLTCELVSILDKDDNDTFEDELLATWVNPVEYDDITVLLNGEEVEELPGDATEARVPAGFVGEVSVEVRGEFDATSASAHCALILDRVPPPVGDLVCARAATADVELSWNPSGNYEFLQILLDGDVEDELLGDATSYLFKEAPEPGTEIGVRDSFGGTVFCNAPGLVSEGACAADIILSIGEPDGGVLGEITLKDTRGVDSLSVLREGEVIFEELDPTTPSFFDPFLGLELTGAVTYHVLARCEEGETLSPGVTVFIPSAADAQFIRGECNGDGNFDLSDVIALLVALFIPSDDNALSCPDACDFNNDAALTLADPILQLGKLFEEGDDPPAPFPDCGLDTGDSLGCPVLPVCPGPRITHDATLQPRATTLFDFGEQPPPSDLDHLWTEPQGTVFYIDLPGDSNSEVPTGQWAAPSPGSGSEECKPFVAEGERCEYLHARFDFRMGTRDSDFMWGYFYTSDLDASGTLFSPGPFLFGADGQLSDGLHFDPQEPNHFPLNTFDTWQSPFLAEQKYPTHNGVPILRSDFIPDDEADDTGPVDQIGLMSLPGKSSNAQIGGAVIVHSGEFFFQPPIPQLAFPGRDTVLEFPFSYRSQVDYSGPLGENWCMWPVCERIVPLPGGGFLRLDARRFRVEAYDEDGTAPGIFDHIEVTDSGIARVGPHGDVYLYHGFNGLPNDGMLQSHTDRKGNLTEFLYDEEDRNLVSVIDTLGREIRLEYDEFDRLVGITDFYDKEGRTLGITYDGANRITELTGTPVTGTPNDDDGISSNGGSGNDFPDGRSYRLQYDSGCTRALISGVVYPNEVADGSDDPRLRVHYDENGLRVTSVRIGGSTREHAFADSTPVPTLGTYHFDYTDLVKALPDDLVDTEVRQTTVTDPCGNVSDHLFNAQLHEVRRVEYSNRDVNAGDPDEFETLRTWSADHLPLSVVLPSGNSLVYEYDVTNPNRGAQRNCLRRVFTPDDSRSGDQAELVTTYTYEPIYNLRRTVTTPRGNDPIYIPPVPDADVTVTPIDLNLDGDDDDEEDGETTRRLRYTALRIFDYQEGTAGDILDLAVQRGITLDLDGDGPGTEDDLAEALSLGLEDLNGDGLTDQTMGVIIRQDLPTTTLPDGTPQSRVFTYTYNPLGQCTSATDPEGNLTRLYYYPENDPDGNGTSEGLFRKDADETTGGYLKLIVRDDDPVIAASDDASGERPAGQGVENSGTEARTRTADPVAITALYTYDPVGNITSFTDGRGIRDDYHVTAWNLITQVTRAAATDDRELTEFGYVTQIDYDYHGNVICVRREDRNDTSGVGGNNGGTPFVDTKYAYDLLDRCIRVTQEVSDDESLVTRHRYDPNGNRVLVVEPEGNAVARRFDERDLVFQEVRGARVALGPLHLGAGDVIDYDVNGGVPARCTYTYDSNRNLVQRSDGDDSDASPDNNCEVGRGDRTRFVFDGFDRCTGRVDAAENTTVRQYDPDGNVERTSWFGPTGGATPTGDGGELTLPFSEGGELVDANLSGVLLAARERHFDECCRCNEVSDVLVVPVPMTRDADPADGATDLGKGSLVEGDDDEIPGLSGSGILGRVNRRCEYDRNSRPVRFLEDDGDTYEYVYDGVDRVLDRTGPEGNTREYAYDANHNLIEIQDTDVSGIPRVDDEVLVTSFYYDSLDRRTRRVDNMGHTEEYRYDSRDNLVARSDAEGPDGDATTRHVFEGGTGTVNDINAPGNITYLAYDGLDRLILELRPLTESGAGDGSTVGATEEGDFQEGPEVDEAQGGGDGFVATGYGYDGNSRRVLVVNDAGDATSYLYDNLNRRIVESRGLTTDLEDLSPELLTGGRAVPALTRATRSSPALVVPPDRLDGQVARIAGLVEFFGKAFPPGAEVVDPITARICGFDPDGNCRVYIDDNGSEHHRDFDALNRRVAVRVFRAGQFDSHDGDPTFAPTPLGVPADPSALVVGSNHVDYEYDGLSRRVGSVDLNHPTAPEDDVETRTVYDSLHRVVEEGTTVGGGTEQLVTRRWRAENLCGGVVYPDGSEVEYAYDGLDRVTTVTRGKDTLAELTYLGPHRVISCEHSGPGVTRLYTYDALRRLTRLEHADDEGTTILAYDYDYDRRDNRVSTDPEHMPENAETYVYDSINRLLEAGREDEDAIELGRASWGLDGNDNWLTVNDDETRLYSNFNELTERDDDGLITLYTYDANGNLRSDGTRTYLYDSFDRLNTVRTIDPDQLVSTYAYDGLHRRIVTAIPDGKGTFEETRFYHDGWQVIEEQDSIDDTVRRFTYIYTPVPSEERISIDVDGDDDGVLDLYYYADDALGSTGGLFDDGGSLVEGYLYDPYSPGTLFTPGANGVLDFGGDDDAATNGGSIVGNPYLWRGERRDPETGLYFLRSRYYEPDMGRFLTPDTYSADSRDPRTLHRYVYSIHDPLGRER